MEPDNVGILILIGILGFSAALVATNLYIRKFFITVDKRYLKLRKLVGTTRSFDLTNDLLTWKVETGYNSRLGAGKILILEWMDGKKSRVDSLVNPRGFEELNYRLKVSFKTKLKVANKR